MVTGLEGLALLVPGLPTLLPCRSGNAAGAEFDLGVAGAFTGLKVVVIQQYGFDFRNARQAMQVGVLLVRQGLLTATHWCGIEVCLLVPAFTCGVPACVGPEQEKGFEVTLFSDKVELDALKAALANANQVWLISGSSNLLSEDMLAAIVEEWRAGMGVYVFGDNKPYYADANRLLKVCVCVCANTYVCLWWWWWGGGGGVCVGGGRGVWECHISRWMPGHLECGAWANSNWLLHFFPAFLAWLQAVVPHPHLCCCTADSFFST
jgi:hypothetical protein